MGRWMQAFNDKGEVVVEMAPNFLMYCLKWFPKKSKEEFPIISNLTIDSENWIDELQIFKLESIIELKAEIERMYGVLNYKEFVANVSAEEIRNQITSDTYSLESINTDIYDLQSFFEKSIELGLTVKISL